MRTGITAAKSAQRAPELSSKSRTKIAFFLTLFYLFLEYGRPQALLPPLRFLHLSALTAVMLAVLLLVGKK